MMPEALPEVVPLPTASPDEAAERQQRLIRATMQHLPDNGVFHFDVGVNPPLGRPRTTAQVEKVFASAFGAEDAALVQGAGTGAIRAALQAGPWAEGERRLIIHDAPIYSTTKTTFAGGLVEPLVVNYNDRAATERLFADPKSPAWVYVQHSRQQLEDSYNPEEIVALATRHGKRVIVDDNYAVLRAPKIGTEMGAAASCFSLFKLHGPEGVGIVVGDADIVERAREQNYSGGGQVQGPQAIWALQAVVEGCLNWAKGSQETLKLVDLLNSGSVPGVVDARAGNLQDLCALVLLDGPKAAEVREKAGELGAATYPVGSNSRYEIAPMVYRLSGSSLATNPELAECALRINPMRASAETVVEMLKEALQQCS